MIYWLFQIVFGIRTNLLAIQSWADDITSQNLWFFVHKMKNKLPSFQKWLSEIEIMNVKPMVPNRISKNISFWSAFDLLTMTEELDLTSLPTKQYEKICSPISNRQQRTVAPEKRKTNRVSNMITPVYCLEAISGLCTGRKSSCRKKWFAELSILRDQSLGEGETEVTICFGTEHRILERRKLSGEKA